MSQVKLSAIKAARYGYETDYLLGLVERLGGMTRRLVFRHHSTEHNGRIEDCTYPRCRAARTLLKELEL